MGGLKDFVHEFNNFGRYVASLASQSIQKYNASFTDSSKFRRVGDRFPIQRKGEAGNLSSAAVSSLGIRLPEKKITRHLILAPQTLRRLADTDPITWAIKRTRRHQISHARWDLVPKLDEFLQEVDKWQEILFDNLNNWGYLANIALQHIPEDLYFKYKGELDSIFTNPTNKFDKKARIKWIIKALVRDKKDRALKHCNEIRKIFNRPCNEYSTLGALQEILTDDMLIFDAGILVKNKDRLGRLAEIYPLPGEEIFLYRNEDRTIPEPPEPAFLWEESGSKKAEFTKDELVYVMCNPQHNFYGRSPIEVSSYVITTSLYADSYNMDFFKYSDVPPGIIDLGKDINDDQRRAFKAAWEAEKAGRGGIFRMMFTSGSEGVQFIPLRTQTQKDIQLQEYLKWSLSIKCACFQISPQDIGFTMDLHRTTSETQLQISRDSGLRVLLEKLSDHYNNDIIKSEFPAYKDSKFQYLDMDTVDEVTQNNMALGRYEAGASTLNETREKMGLKAVPGGDVLLSQKIPGQGFMPVGLLEKEADNLEMAIEQQASQTEEAAQSGQQTDEAGNPTGGQTPEEGVPGQEQVQQEVVIPQDKAGLNKLQKVISNMKSGNNLIVKFDGGTDYSPFDNEAHLRRMRLEGFKAGLGHPQLEAASDVFSENPNERTRGTYTIMGMIAAPAVLGIGVGAKAIAPTASKAVGRSLFVNGVKLLDKMPGNKLVNSKIISGPINFYRGKVGLKPISNLHRWLLTRAKQAVKLGWRIK